MAEDLGKINVNKTFKKDPQTAIQEFMALNSVARPSSVVVKPQEVQQTIANQAKKSFLGSVLERLPIGMMAMGEGMTGRPFYTNYMNNQTEMAKSKQDMERWSVEQKRKQTEDESQAENRALNAQIMKRQLEMMGEGQIDSATINGINTPLKGKATEYNPEDYAIKQKVVMVRGIPTIQEVPELKPPLPSGQEKAYRGILNTELAMMQNVEMLAKNPNIEKLMGPLRPEAQKGGNPYGDLGNVLLKLDPKKKEFAVFKAETDKTFQTFRKETTGAQAALAELGWLAPDYPETSDNPALYKEKAAVALQRMAEAKDLLKNYWGQNYRMSGLDAKRTPKSDDFSSMSDDELKKIIAGGK